MKTGMILGIIGGIIGLLIGVVGFGLSSVGESASAFVGANGAAGQMQFYKFASILLPIIGLIGSGMAGKNSNLAVGLMALSAIGMLWSFGIGVMSLVPAVLLGIGALLIALDKDKGPYASK